MALLNQKAFERKLQNMSSTQDSVQTVSLWMIHHKKHAEDMVTVWLDQLKKASKADRRLVLFYLANDVLQNSRKKGKEFSNAFTKILRDAMVLLSDKTIKANVQRVIKIWEERRLFESDFLEALRGKLDLGGLPVVSKKTKEKAVEKEREKEVKPIKQKRLPPADFKPSKLIDALKALRDFEGELTLKESQLNSLRIDVSDLETVRQLKDRTGGGKFCEEYELATAKLEEFSELLKREQQERTNLMKVLEDGEAFYETSHGEVKVIVHAYKTFGNRLTSLKKKVDAKVNRLAQKAAEKAKTGPVSAPQASFLTSGLPDVGEESASSTPSQTQPETDKSPEEDKAVDPTVDNIEVADMDIEDDSDSEKSETSEEASADDHKSSNDQTPNSIGSPDSQPTKSTPQELENSTVIPPAVSTAPAQPLGPHVRPMMPVQSSLLPSQPQIVSPQPSVGLVIRPFIGVQRFPAPAPQFRPGVPPMQATPGMAQTSLLQPAGTLAGPGQMPSQGQPFQQMTVGLIPNANVPIGGGMGTMQPFQLGSGFVHNQAPLPVAATTVPVHVQMTSNSAPTSEASHGSESDPQAVVDVGSPDSEASAPSPVGSPELHLEEGDETPETTPAPLGDVHVKDKTGFETNESFFENPVKNPTINSSVGFSRSSSADKTLVGSPSSNGKPSTSEQPGAQQQDSASVKKDNGQKVSAVDILAQLLSRGRKLQETTVQGSDSLPTSVYQPVSTSAAVAETSKGNSGNPPTKPLLTLIDTLFPKLSDSIKTLKEKEKHVNPSETHLPSMSVGNTPSTSLPARPLPCKGHFQDPSGDVSQPPFQQSELKSSLKQGPNEDQDVLECKSSHAERPSLPSNVSEEMPLGMPGEVLSGLRDDSQSGVRDHREYQGKQLGSNEVTSLPSSRGHPGNQLCSSPLRGVSPRFPREMPFERVSDLVPHGPAPFEQRGPYPRPRGPPSFNPFRSTAPFGEGPSDKRGPPHIHLPRDPPFERPLRGPADINEQVPPYGPPQTHSPRGPPLERHAERPADQPRQVPDQPPLVDSPRGPPALHEQVLPNRPGPPHLSSPRGPPGDIHHNVVPNQSPHRHSPRGSLKDCPVVRPPDSSPGHSSGDPTPSHDGLKKASNVPVEEKRSTTIEKGSHVNGPPGIRRISREGALQRSLEPVPRSAVPQPHRASYPGVGDDEERRRQFEHWEDPRREGYREHARAPWDFPHDFRGPPPPPPPPHWRGPPMSPRRDPNRADFREDDPCMWTSFESPGKSPGRHMDFPNRTREGFREGPPGFERFGDYGPPPGRRRHSVGDFEGGWMHHPGPLKRPGPPPIPFPAPSKRPHY